MEFVGPLARACRAIPLVLVVSAGTAEAAPYAGPAEAAQIALSANGQQLNNFIGRGVALADFDGDGDLDAFVVNQVTWESHDAPCYRATVAAGSRTATSRSHGTRPVGLAARLRRGPQRDEGCDCRPRDVAQ